VSNEGRRREKGGGLRVEGYGCGRGRMDGWMDAVRKPVLEGDEALDSDEEPSAGEPFRA
jgi:hypothetical protein